MKPTKRNNITNQTISCNLSSSYKNTAIIDDTYTVLEYGTKRKFNLTINTNFIDGNTISSINVFSWNQYPNTGNTGRSLLYNATVDNKYKIELTGDYSYLTIESSTSRDALFIQYDAASKTVTLRKYIPNGLGGGY